MSGYTKHIAGAVMDQRAAQEKAKGSGHKLPGWLIAKMKRQQELEKQIQALREYISCVKHDSKPFLAVGEYAWHEARRKR